MIDAQKVTGGNQDAIYFLDAWGKYLRCADDTVDENKWDSDNLITCFALGNTVFSSRFYRQHSMHLQMAILVGASLWAIANEWERQSEKWKIVHAEVLRNTDILLLNAVCQICTGWKMAGEASRALLAAGYATHVKKYGSRL